jgi:hypothetical protein
MSVLDGKPVSTGLSHEPGRLNGQLRVLMQKNALAIETIELAYNEIKRSVG